MRQRELMQSYLYKLVHGEKSGIIAEILLLILRLFSLIYGLGVDVMLSLYKYGILKQHKLPCKVISLGNITIGGTGKTPTAQKLAALIQSMGFKVVVLNRGYRSGWKGEVGLVSDGKKIFMTAGEAGDEAFLLAKNLPGVPVVIGKNRSVTGDYAVNKLKAEVIILDDGYQHWQLVRDLDIVLIDALNIFGNNFLLPRGTLREPLANLNRAHAFLLTKVDQSTDNARDTIKDTVARYNDKALVVESIHCPKGFIEIEEWYKGSRPTAVALEEIQGCRVIAFSAIGNPSSFERTVSNLGATIADTIRYPDHHHYSMLEMQTAMQQAVEAGACAIITTDKDAVKIPSEFIYSDRPLPVYVLLIEVRCVEGYEEFMKLIKAVAIESVAKCDTEHCGGRLK